MKFMILWNELCIKWFMKSYDFMWELCIKIIYEKPCMILCEDLCIKVFMKNHDFMWEVMHHDVLWKNVISFEIYDMIWQDMTSMYVISFEIYDMTSMQIWLWWNMNDKIRNGLCYDMKTVPMLWAYCIARLYMLVVHPVCLPYVWIPQPAATGGIGIYLDSLTLTHGGQQWVSAYDKWKISSCSCSCYLRMYSWVCTFFKKPYVYYVYCMMCAYWVFDSV